MHRKCLLKTIYQLYRFRVGIDQRKSDDSSEQGWIFSVSPLCLPGRYSVSPYWRKMEFDTVWECEEMCITWPVDSNKSSRFCKTPCFINGSRINSTCLLVGSEDPEITNKVLTFRKTGILFFCVYIINYSVKVTGSQVCRVWRLENNLLILPQNWRIVYHPRVLDNSCLKFFKLLTFVTVKA